MNFKIWVSYIHQFGESSSTDNDVKKDIIRGQEAFQAMIKSPGYLQDRFSNRNQ